MKIHWAKKLRATLTSERIALSCFVAYVVAAYPAIVFHFGKDEWFVHDDWNFIVGNVLRNVFTPVEHHWSTLPILIYRLYYGLLGANYLPFLATVSALHLGVVSLLRVVMRRSGVNSWLASIAAAELVMFAPGYMSIAFAIQITQNLSLLFGIAQMILADHDGKIDRRDWAGVFVGMLSLMSSGLAPVLIIGVGISTLIRRGVVAAAFHTVPLGAVFVTWFLATQNMGAPDWFRLPYGESHPFLFIAYGVQQSLAALGHFQSVAVAVSLVALAGLVLHFRMDGRAGLSKTAVPLALLCCAPVYFGVIGLQRSRLGFQYIGWGHHLYTGALFFLPVLAFGTESLGRLSKFLAPALAVGLLALIPLNAQDFGANASRNLFLTTTFIQQNRHRILAIAHSRFATVASELDRGRPVTDVWYSHGLTLGWVLDEAKSGRLPPPGPVEPDLADFVELFYGVIDTPDASRNRRCAAVARTLDMRPNRGEEIVVQGPVTVLNVRRSETYVKVDFEKPTGNSLGHVLRIVLPNLHLQLAPAPGAESFSYCSESPSAEPMDEPPSAPSALSDQVVQDPAAMDHLRKAIQADPAAMESLRKAIQQDPAAMEALRKELAASQGQ